MYIIVKTIDIFKSKIHRGRTISEYIIYIMIGDISIKAYLAYNRDALLDKIDELMKEHNINDVFYETK